MRSSRNDRRAFFALFALVTLVAQGCGSEGGREEQHGPPPSIVLLSLDTVRADRLGVYGYARPTTPELDAIAAESFVFTNAYTPSPNTLVAHASMLTGLYPLRHGARREQRIATTVTLLAEIFSDAGYATAGFTAHADWLTEEYGFGRGFDVFAAEYEAAPAVHQRALAWLRDRPSGPPAFLFLHNYDAHSDWKKSPYESRTDRLGIPGALDGFRGCRGGACASGLLRKAIQDPTLLSHREVAWASDLYDEGLVTLDAAIGSLFRELVSSGFLDHAWLVITSDHGEEFREHGSLLHHQPYEEIARVPLIIRPPGGLDSAVGATRADLPALVNLVDLMPTVLDLAGLATPRGLDGRSFSGLLRSQPTVPHTALFFNELITQSNVTVRTDDYTLVTRDWLGRLELYDRRADRTERRDLLRDISSPPPLELSELESLAGRYLEEQFAREPQRGLATETAEDEEARRRLEALGYVN